MASAALPAKKSVPRKDPRGRTHDGANTGVKLINRNPDRVYVGAAQGTGAVDEYLGRGYEIERYEEGGVRFSVKTAKPGDAIEYKGHVLMSISKEARDYIDQYGEDGESGWAEADKVEAKIIDKRGAQRDLMRGLHGGYVGVEHDVGALEPVV